MDKTGCIRFVVVLCAAVVMLVSSAQAWAEGGEEDPYLMDSVQVTAQKRAEDPQKIPSSLTVIDETLVEDADIGDMDDLSRHVPNLEYRDFGNRRHGLSFIRGLKSHGLEPAMGLYVDGVNYSKPYMFDFPLFDVERIEVLKGSQGTLYGRNTMGGVVNVVTRQPDSEVSGDVSTEVAGFGGREVKAGVNVPLLEDRLFMRFSGLFSQTEGYMKNDYGDDGDSGRHKEGKAGRLRLRWLPTDDWDVTLGLDTQVHDDGSFPYRRTKRNSLVKKGRATLDDEGHYSHDYDGTQENSYWGMNLSADRTMAWGTVTSITGFRDYDDDEDIDSDFSPLDMARMNYKLKEQALSQEFRLASEDEPGRDLQWLLGVNGFMIDKENDTTTYYRPGMAGSGSNPFRPNTGDRLVKADMANQGAALFGQATYTVFERLDLTVGLRGEYESAEMDSVTLDTPTDGSTSQSDEASGTNHFSSLLPKLSAAWRVTDAHMLYVSYSGAHRSGGFNVQSPVGKEAYDEETSWQYEVGSKSCFLDRRLTLNLAGFHTIIEDEQVSQFSNEINRSYLDNAGESHRTGLEAEAGYELLQGLKLTVGYSYIEAEYDEFFDPDAGTDYGGHRVFGVPEYTYNLAGQYRRPLSPEWTLFGRVEMAGYGPRYFDDANTVRQSGYELVNAKIGVEGEHLDCYLWARNLLDREYVIFENVTKGLAEDGEPLVVGVTVGWRF